MAGLLDASTFLDPGDAVDFIANVLEVFTEYSIIGKDLDGLNSDILHDSQKLAELLGGRAASPRRA